MKSLQRPELMPHIRCHGNIAAAADLPAWNIPGHKHPAVMNEVVLGQHKSNMKKIKINKNRTGSLKSWS